MRALAKRLLGEEGGAIAPVFALALPMLIMAGGIAFDYARLAALDTELQNAADQAALAAASQLDGGSNAITRATTAAQGALVLNKTRFANDGNASGTTVTVPTLIFYSAYDSAADTGTLVDPSKSVAIQSASAKFVQVTVGNRYATYALTPIVGLLKSGDMNASAIAGLGSGICQVPPLMFCAPTPDFPGAADIGKGVRLQPGPNPGAWVPGDYGYLDFANGASGLATNLGSNQSAGGCFDNSGGLQTEPGNKASVTKALNSRFDLYGPSTTACDSSTGDFCPAENTRKDFVKTEEVEFEKMSYPEIGTDTDGVNDLPPLPSSLPANPGCGTTSGVSSGLNYTSKTTADFVQRATAKGFNRDNCHVDGTCTSNFGNGTWNVGTYCAANHPGATSACEAGVTRYGVYKWELADKANRMGSNLADMVPDYKTSGKNNGRQITHTFTNYCAYSVPKNGTGVVAGAMQKDRRIVQAASVDCTGLNGKGSVKVLKWLDMFLVEPSADRTLPYATGKEQIYAEIIGVATKPDGSSAFQFYSRNRPFLIK